MPVVMISGHGTIEMAVARDPARRLRLHREAVPVGSPAAGGAPRAGGRGAGARERRAAAARRAGDQPDRRAAKPISLLRAGVEKVAPTGSRVLIAGPAGVRQGSRGAHDPRQLPPRRRAVRGAELRHPRAGTASRRSCSASRPAPTRWPSRAAPACWNAPMAARCCSTRSPTCRWRPRARSCGRLQDQTFERLGGSARVKVDVRVIVDHQQGSAGRDHRRALPRRPVLPPGRGAAEGAGAEGPAGGCARAGVAVPRPLGRGLRHAGARAVRRRRRRRCRLTNGRATCGSCAT